nr:unnamed protein product [Callosobruchus analis]CAI5867696.1 unnamed protein product [Callosobruchus analis]
MRIVSYCPDNVDYTKCISKRRQELQEETLSNIDCNGAAILTTEDYSSALKVIERHIDPNLLNIQRQKAKIGQCYSLFELWNLCKVKVSIALCTIMLMIWRNEY